jgi:peptidoglycan/xylan/chitin deacetylase (PgdA/CDA1 family)
MESIWSFSVLRTAAPSVVWRVDTRQPLVALSFDDGPHPLYTPQVLALLARDQAHATFFLVGERAAAHPNVVAAIKAGGHEVGNHYLHRGTALGAGRSFRSTYVKWLVKKNLVPGAIVILHDGVSDPSRGIQALPEILAEGRRRGIRFVTVGALLESIGATEQRDDADEARGGTRTAR